MKKNQEFTINSRKDQFRIPYISPVKILAISTQVDLEKFQQTETLYNFALENTEVKMGEKWIPVKTPNQDIYMPMGIEDDLIALNEICMYFITEVIYKPFQKSSESA